MAEVTDGDRERAGQVAERTAYRGRKVLEKAIAAALAEERERARAPFLALAERWEAVAEELGWARGEHYSDCASGIHRAAIERQGVCGDPSPAFLFGGDERSRRLCELTFGHGGMHEHLNPGDMQPMRWTHGVTRRAAEENE